MATDADKTNMPLVELRHISKYFLESTANDDISLTVYRGEICALLGENGAGKSTLMNILFGLYGCDSGEICVNGKTVLFANPGDAIKSGIGMIHQHFTLIPGLTVFQNLILGPYGHAGFIINRTKILKKIESLIDKYHFSINPDALVGSLSIGQKQKVEILKALYRGANLLIMDEPTAVLSPAESESLFETLRGLVDQGLSIILISHKMKEIIGVTDRVFVLRHGKLIAERKTAETDASELASLMIGRAQDDTPVYLAAEVESKNKEPVLSLCNLSVQSETGVQKLDHIDLAAYGGEVLGIAGVSGNGQTELCNILFGLMVPQSGSVSINGENLEFGKPWKIIKQKMARIPEDRIGTGLLMEMSVEENILLGAQHRLPYCSPSGFLRKTIVRTCAEQRIAEFDISPKNSRSVVRSLSGGNLQKVILARELERSPSLIVAAQPTRGLDIGATAFIHRRLTDEKLRGVAVVVVSDDLDELFSISDRIAVISGGKIIGTQQRTLFDRDKIGLWISGVVQ